jgi:hypothetical protein
VLLLLRFRGFHLCQHRYALTIRCQIPLRSCEFSNPYPRLIHYKCFAFSRAGSRCLNIMTTEASVVPITVEKLLNPKNTTRIAAVVISGKLVNRSTLGRIVANHRRQSGRYLAQSGVGFTFY